MPKGFRFNLQPELDRRTRVERDRQIALAAIERDRLVLEERLRAAQRDIGLAKHEVRSRLVGGGVNVPELRMQAAASLHQVGLAQRLAIELAGVYARIEQARAALLKASSDRKGVELIREKRFEEWRQEHLRRENAQLEEVASQQYFRAARDRGAQMGERP
ncbi:MAG: flagellar FliJ family protein [Phycisphaerales bacterium]|nr:flagellar FliJ family protein [Phycisphaerales bacterium]